MLQSHKDCPLLRMHWLAFSSGGYAALVVQTSLVPLNAATVGPVLTSLHCSAWTTTTTRVQSRESLSFCVLSLVSPCPCTSRPLLVAAVYVVVVLLLQQRQFSVVYLWYIRSIGRYELSAWLCWCVHRRVYEAHATGSWCCRSGSSLGVVC